MCIAYTCVGGVIVLQIGWLSFSLNRQIYSFHLKEYINCKKQNIYWEKAFSSLKMPHRGAASVGGGGGGSICIRVTVAPLPPPCLKPTLNFPPKRSQHCTHTVFNKVYCGLDSFIQTSI